MGREFERMLSCWKRYLDARPWRRIDADAVFRVDDDRSGELFYAVVTGQAGEVYGLGMSRGEDGLRVLGGIIRQEVDHDQAAALATSLCISIHDEPFPRWYRRFLREALGRKKGFGGLPLVYVNEGTGRPRPPDVLEARILAGTLEAVAALIEHDALNPPVFKPGEPMPCIRLRGDGTFELSEVTPEFRLPEVERFRLPPDLAAAFRGLPRLDTTDLVSCYLAPAFVGGSKVRLLSIVDPVSEAILAGECFRLEDREGIARCLLSAYKGRNMTRRTGVPREIQTDSRHFYETFKDALSEIGIRIVCFQRIPALENVRESFAEFLGRAVDPPFPGDA